MAEPSPKSLVMSDSASRRRATARVLGQSTLFLVTFTSVVILFFIFYFMGRDAFPFFWNSTVHNFQFQSGVFGTDDADRQPVLRPWAAGKDVKYWRAMIPEDYAGVFEEAFGMLGVELIGEHSPAVASVDDEQREGIHALALYLKEDTLPKDPAALRDLLEQVGEMVSDAIPRTKLREIKLVGKEADSAPDAPAEPIASLADVGSFTVVIKQNEPMGKAVDRAREFFTTTDYNPSLEPPQFGALSFFFGSFMVTVGAILLAVPLGIAAAVCLSDVLPFGVRQWVKPVIEIIAAIPSVAYGFFALVVFAPLLQNMGGRLIGGFVLVVGVPLALFTSVVLAELVVDKFGIRMKGGTTVFFLFFATISGWLLFVATVGAFALKIDSGTNALNVSIMLGIMALPTIVSVSEDALQAVPRNIREGSYGLGATRAETMLLTVIPSAMSGIVAAVILGIMRAVGETMVVWMAAGNARAMPSPLYNYLAPIRTLTATIAGDMGEADQSIGSLRYHVLFAMAFCLLTISFCMNLASEWVVRRQRRKLEGQ
jgi:phosphate transport system permease protein